MSDLIRREDAIEAIQKRADKVDSVYSAFWEGLIIAQDIVKNIPSADPERKIIRCEDCIYFDPAHVEKDGLRYEYKDMPEEAYGPFGTPGCVTVKYGINVGSRCTYEQDKLVFRHRNDFCSRAEMRGDR